LRCSIRRDDFSARNPHESAYVLSVLRRFDITLQSVLNYRFTLFLHKGARMRSNKLCTFLFLLLTGVPSLDAQVAASITGVITDTSGARVPSAAITVTNVETGAIRGTLSDEAGRYQVLALPVGEYEIRVSKTGFPEQLRTGVHLVVGQEAAVD
jgi:carboxypeptidase family protein